MAPSTSSSPGRGDKQQAEHQSVKLNMEHLRNKNSSWRYLIHSQAQSNS
jgi:hypothetical protein